MTDPLKTTLLDLLYELRDADVPLLLGGGYGLYLKQEATLAGDAPRLLDLTPPLRATNDLDLFLRTELIADSERLRPLRAALDRLGFTVIPSAQNYQFARKFTLDGIVWDIKVDLLTRTPDPAVYPHLKFDARRVKPHPSVGLHAHRTDEALAIEDGAEPLELTGERTSGETFTGTVFLPPTYAFLMMKLFALNDQKDDAAKLYGEKHSLDLYTLVSLLTEAEYQATLALRDRYQSSPEAQMAARLVGELFATTESIGSLRLRRNESLPRDVNHGDFTSLLREVFPERERI